MWFEGYEQGVHYWLWRTLSVSRSSPSTLAECKCWTCELTCFCKWHISLLHSPFLTTQRCRWSSFVQPQKQVKANLQGYISHHTPYINKLLLSIYYKHYILTIWNRHMNGSQLYKQNTQKTTLLSWRRPSRSKRPRFLLFLLHILLV